VRITNDDKVLSIWIDHQRQLFLPEGEEEWLAAFTITLTGWLEKLLLIGYSAMCITMAFIHLQDLGGNASSAMTSSILLHCAANLAAIHLVATAGVAKMSIVCVRHRYIDQMGCAPCPECEEECAWSVKPAIRRTSASTINDLQPVKLYVVNTTSYGFKLVCYVSPSKGSVR
jgi:hypothetical protein